MKKYYINNMEIIVQELLHNKSLIAPTDTVAGILSIDKNNIYKIKERDLNKEIIKFINNPNSITNDKKFIKLANEFWPGKLTLIKNGISYRMPKNEFILKVISVIGPLYCSSANISGKKTIKSFDEAKIMFNKYLDDIIFLDSIYDCENIPSTIYDIDKDIIVRKGEITYEQIKSKL